MHPVLAGKGTFSNKIITPYKLSLIAAVQTQLSLACRLKCTNCPKWVFLALVLMMTVPYLRVTQVLGGQHSPVRLHQLPQVVGNEELGVLVRVERERLHPCLVGNICTFSHGNGRRHVGTDHGSWKLMS